MKRNFNKVFSSLKKIAKANLPAGTQVLLYGSRARGDANETSDWDVLIILDKDKLEKSDYDNVKFFIPVFHRFRMGGLERTHLKIPVILYKL